MKVLSKILWTLTIIGALLGTLTLIATLMDAESAPQEAAGAAIAVSFAIIPYVLARAVSEIRK